MEGFKEANLSKRAIRALLAGHDMILISVVSGDDIIRVYQDLLTAFKQGIIPKHTVDNSLKKILKLKLGLTYETLPLAKKIQLIEQSQKKLYLINKKMTQTMVDVFFKNNPYLKNSLSKDIKLVSFSNQGYEKLKNLKYFTNHKKNILLFKNKKLTLQNNNFNTLNTVGFCYGKTVKLCDKYFTKTQKANIIMIDTQNKPLRSLAQKDYKIYIPSYGLFPGVGEMFLNQLISKN